MADDAGAHVEKVRARAAIETDELRRRRGGRPAHRGVVGHRDGSHPLRGRPQDRGSARGLDEYLKQHDSIIDTEIDGVNDAVREYDSTLDRFFEELAQADDPSTIVARAEALPAPPDLDQVRRQARARAVAMFADVEDPVAEVAQVAPAAQAAPIAEAMVEPEPMTAPSPEAMVAEAGREARSLDRDGRGDGHARDGGADQGGGDDRNAARGSAPTAQSDGAGSMADVQPIPVMDPDATADSTGPRRRPRPNPSRWRPRSTTRVRRSVSYARWRHGRPRRILGRTTAPTPTDPAPTGRLTNPMAAPPSGAAALYSAGLVHPRSRRSANGAATDDRAAVAAAQSAEHRIVAPKVMGSSPIGHPIHFDPAS